MAHFTDEKTKARRTMTDTRTHGQGWGQSQTQAVARASRLLTIRQPCLRQAPR